MVTSRQTGAFPTLHDYKEPVERSEATEKGRAEVQWDLKPARRIGGIPVDPRCSSAPTPIPALNDLRDGHIRRGKNVRKRIKQDLIVFPAPARIKAQAEKEALDQNFHRSRLSNGCSDAGCTCASGMNGRRRDAARAQTRTSNRNSKAAQGKRKSARHSSAPVMPGRRNCRTFVGTSANSSSRKGMVGNKGD